MGCLSQKRALLPVLSDSQEASPALLQIQINYEQLFPAVALMISYYYCVLLDDRNVQDKLKQTFTRVNVTFPGPKLYKVIQLAGE